MVDFELLRDEGVLVISPRGPLETSDFERLAKAVDPFIAEKGKLAGIMIRTESFPGWKSFGALVSHLRFVGDHHRKIKRLALVTDSRLGDIAPAIGKHLVAAEIKHFAFGEKDEALAWLEAGA